MSVQAPKVSPRAGAASRLGPSPSRLQDRSFPPSQVAVRDWDPTITGTGKEAQTISKILSHALSSFKACGQCNNDDISSCKSQRRSDATTRINPNTHRSNWREILGPLDNQPTCLGSWVAAPAFGVDKSPWGPGGFSSLPDPARVPGALTSGREVAALGHHGCGTTDRQPRLPFPSSHPPPQPSSHLARTSRIRSRVGRQLFLVGTWHHTLSFRSSNYLRPPSEGGPDCGIRFPLFDPPFSLLSSMEGGADSIIRWWLLRSADTSCRCLTAATDRHHTQRF